MPNANLEIGALFLLLLLELLDTTLDSASKLADFRVVGQNPREDNEGVSDLGVVGGFQAGNHGLGYAVMPLMNHVAVVLKF